MVSSVQLGKMRFVGLVLILIQNPHAISGDWIFSSLASRMTNAVSRLYWGNGESVAALPKPENESLTPVEMIRENNYPVEAHEIITEDGYILTVFRIPGSPKSVPVYLQHGLLESAVDWVIPGRGRSLAYILSDRGYDVWLGNVRGNTYSKKHKTLSTSDPKFWDFSWTEQGEYDLPAVITYITNLKKNSLFYIGHSMGATMFSVMAIEKPEIARKVRAMIGVAPATYVYYAPGAIKLIAPAWKQLWQIAKTLGIYEILPRSTFLDAFSKYVCNTLVTRDFLCSNVLFIIAGFDPDQLDYSLLPKIWKSFPAGTSSKLFTHWLQQMSVNKFRKFDYGYETNLKVYNSSEPPDYDLSKVQVPVAIFWSENDYLVGVKDAENFYNQLSYKLGSHKVPHEKFNHFDFLWGYDAPEFIYSKILDIFSEYNNQIINN